MWVAKNIGNGCISSSVEAMESGDELSGKAVPKSRERSRRSVRSPWAAIGPLSCAPLLPTNGEMGADVRYNYPPKLNIHEPNCFELPGNVPAPAAGD